MSKKKQSRYSVSIPYELRDYKLWMQQISWPHQCPCCNERIEAGLSKHKFSHRANNFQFAQLPGAKHPYYSLDWEVPYCSQCLAHVKSAEFWTYGLPMIIIFGLLILLFWLGSSLSDIALILLITGIIVGALAFYKTILELVIKPKLKSTCLDYHFAIWASSPVEKEYNIIFHFDRDEYAQTFAVLNSAELEINS